MYSLLQAHSLNTSVLPSSELASKTCTAGRWQRALVKEKYLISADAVQDPERTAELSAQWRGGKLPLSWQTSEGVWVHVGFNLSFLRPGNEGGALTYAENLVRQMSYSPGIECSIFAAEETLRYFLTDVRSIRRVALKRLLPNSDFDRLWSDLLTVPELGRRIGLDVLHNLSGYGSPTFGRPKQVVTLHDLQHVHFPENFSTVTRLKRALAFEIGRTSVDHFIAVSDFTRSDYVAQKGIPAHRITTIPLGVVEQPNRHNRTVASGNRGNSDGSDSSYYLYPASFDPHKNHQLLFDAFALVRKRTHVEAMPRLLLTGRGTDGDAIRSAIEIRGLHDICFGLGFVPRSKLLDLTAGARALLFPSVFEGFGLPLIEAMSLGVPVVASDIPATREVAGDSAVLVNPHCAEQWAVAIDAMNVNARLHESLSRMGLLRSQQFSWDRTAEETIAVYRGVIGS